MCDIKRPRRREFSETFGKTFMTLNSSLRTGSIKRAINPVFKRNEINFFLFFSVCARVCFILRLLWSSPRQTWMDWSPHGPWRARLWGSPAARGEKAPGDFWVWMGGVLSDLSDYPFGQLDLEKKVQNKSFTYIKLVLRNMNYGFSDRRSAVMCWNINDPNELKAYLLSPFRQQGTFGSGRTGSGFFCVCQQDSFYLLNKRILRFSGRCAAKKRTTVNADPKISKQVVENILSRRYYA